MEKVVERELEIFRNISSRHDYELIISEGIKFSDFMRLDYLLRELGLMSLEIYFSKRHYVKFEKQMEYLETLDTISPIIDYETYFEWKRDFLINIKDKGERDRIRNIFEMS
ncbi:hypothetical protein [Eisenbergiella sp.]